MDNLLFQDEYNKSIYELDDYIQVNGGDGTLLRAVSMYRDKNKPFFGVASGTANFLMNEYDEVHKNAKYKKFRLIKVEVTLFDGTIKTYQVFNDVMFGGNMNIWANFNVHDKEKIIGSFNGGGVIISTAQGSTGINRNNGGAVLPLSSKMWYITGDKTNRKISVPVKPDKLSIIGVARVPLSVWIDGNIHKLDNVTKIELYKGDIIEVIFNDYDEFKRKRRI